MASLNPKTLCRNFTIDEINTKIAFYMEQLEGATVESYDKDTTQGRQKVTSAQIDKIGSILQSWLKAKDCKNNVGGTQIVSGNFRTSSRNGII